LEGDPRIDPQAMSPPRPFSSPILTCAAAAALERRLLGDDDAAAARAMRRAGVAVAEGILRDYQEIGGFPPTGRVRVLAGKGHNAGDALIATGEILRRHAGATATVEFLFGERALKPLAAQAWRELVGAGAERVRAVADARSDASADLVIDGVFGLQFRPPLSAELAAVFRRVNASAIRLRAAVDLPSGLDEPDAFRADFTYATGSVKAPVLATANAGRIRYLDLGFFAGEGDASGVERVLTADVLAPLARLRPAHSDKRSFGHVFIVGGSRSYPGAVLMNVLGALHSGAGLVTAFVPDSLAPAFAARAPEAIWVGWPETPAGGLAMEGRHLLEKRLAQADALAVGSGMAREPETLAMAKALVASVALPTLLDGDALQAEVIAAAKGPLLLTPHAGEFQRVAGQAGLRQFCAKTGATVVLKGPITRVCAASEPETIPPIYHSLYGGPALARGGSGDILAGLAAGQLAGLAASGEPAPRLLAALRAVVWHGLAADALARAHGQTAVTVTHLIDFLPAVLRAVSF
jgi:NAD(P)H-hydrate epimerase